MYPSRKAQIAHLKADKAPTKVSSKYADFIDVFLLKLAIKLLKYTRINNYAIELVDNQQPLYDPIYSLRPVELEMLKTYIENNLASNFIRPCKSLMRVSIFFDKKLDGSLRLCKNFLGLNNLIIKNSYPLFLVGKSLNWLGWAQHFTQLNLTIIYNWI